MNVIRSLFYRYIACNLHRVVHDNGGWRRLSMAVATEKYWVERLSCKAPKIKDMVHETSYLCYLNMISSWSIALTGASFKSLVNNGAPS